jgi:uncharacterized RDD family membrane protein YckC
MSAENLPEDYLSIDTPENVAFGYTVAGIGSRFLAALVDTFLIIILQGIVNLALLLVALNLLNVEGNGFLWLGAFFGLIAFAFLWGYYIFFEMLWNGQSPGKRWVGLRVIRADGTPITLTESIIRNLVRLVDFLPAYYGVGVVTMFINSQSRRLGDLAAGTLVVRDRAPVTLESLAAQSVAPASSQPAPAIYTDWPVERLAAANIEMAEDFLRRREQLTNREALGLTIVQALLNQMNFNSPLALEGQAEKIIMQIVQAYRQRNSG